MSLSLLVASGFAFRVPKLISTLASPSSKMLLGVSGFFVRRRRCTLYDRDFVAWRGAACQAANTSSATRI